MVAPPPHGSRPPGLRRCHRVTSRRSRNPRLRHRATATNHQALHGANSLHPWRRRRPGSRRRSPDGRRRYGPKCSSPRRKFLEMAAKSGYTRPLPLAGDAAPPPLSAVLYVANCGPTVGVTDADVRSAFGAFGEVAGVQAADDSGARIIVRFHDPAAAEAAMAALHGRPCDLLAGRVLHIRYSVPVKPKARPGDTVPVALTASELGIPGIYMVQEFVTAAEEQELLSAVDSRTWKRLAKRRVQHYGYEFLYETRNVDSKQFLGELPTFVSTVLEKIASFPGVKDCTTRLVDQLTVNEYPCGVGLSPHIDTHSAFEEMIFSLSLAGPCIMEFRKYTKGSWRAPSVVNGVDEDSSQEPECIRKAIFLPPRSMLLMSGEGRYAWHHYIPHHKIDAVGGQVIKRNSRRVSFTFRKHHDKKNMLTLISQQHGCLVEKLPFYEYQL